jgi:pyruvate,water dikinase
VARLISGLNGNVTMETNKRLWDLAQVAKTSIVVSDILRSYDPDEAMDRLVETPEGRDFLKELEEFLREFGHREIRLDIIYPTWGEDPAPVFGFLSSYLDSEESQSPYWQQKRLRQERRELTGEVMTNIKRGLKGHTVLAPLFRWMLAQAQTHTRERDTMHFEWTRLFPPLQWLLLELGHPWCKQGYIERQDDIFYLHFEDLEEMVRSPRSFTKEVQSRKEAFELNSSRPWPDIILTVPSWLVNMASQRLCPSLAPRLLYRKDRRLQSTAIKGSSILRRRHARAQTHGLRTNRNERVARTVRHE